MKFPIRLTILAFLLITLPTIAFASTIIPSKTQKATLFTNQAQITKTAQTQVKEGMQTLHIETTAPNIDPDSIQANIFGEGEVLGVQLKRIFLEDVPQDKIKELDDQIKKIENEMEGLRAQESVNNKQTDFLDSIADFFKNRIETETPSPLPDADKLSSTLTFLKQQYTSIFQNQLSTNQTIKELNNKLTALRRQREQLMPSGRKQKNVIEISFLSSKTQLINLEAKYIVSPAQWSPLYKINVDDNLKDTELTLLAQATQITGEEWKDIIISLSNAVPLRGIDLPELNSWQLNFQTVKPERTLQKTKFFNKKSGNAAMMDMVQEEAAPAKFMQAQRNQSAVAFEYTLPHSITIPSGNQQTILPVFTKSLEGTFTYYSVPKINPLTFLSCKVPTDPELLPGPLNIYLEGQYVGQMQMPKQNPGETFTFGLGADRAVQVKREKITDKKDEMLFGAIQKGDITRKLTYKITAQNTKDKVIVLNVFDHVPVSQTDKIEVKDVELSPAPTQKNYEDQEGVMLWTLRLAPGETKNIMISFSIKYPKDANILF